MVGRVRYALAALLLGVGGGSLAVALLTDTVECATVSELTSDGECVLGPLGVTAIPIWTDLRTNCSYCTEWFAAGLAQTQMHEALEAARGHCEELRVLSYVCSW
jgi:hypothetical protein